MVSLPGNGFGKRPLPGEFRRLFPIRRRACESWETTLTQKSDHRSALSIGIDWSTRVTTIGLEFALPAFLGFFLDRYMSTAPWMTVLGAFLGLGIGMVHLVRLASELSASSRKGGSARPSLGPDKSSG
jgi:hypothetical protein